ncbi:MAG TPA: hypothetical protein VJB90_02755 [Candidatus Nanoarchaeia archaeon]|nr:hypothetical protein [Candidatus Nanoarchaeia archaeon]
MAWYPILGWGVFWIGLVVAIILYAMKRKWYPMMFLISVSLYIFTVGFVIDVFSLNKNVILILLAVSSVLMIGVGYYMSKKLLK